MSVLARVSVERCPSRQPGSIPSAPVVHSADGTLAWSGFFHENAMRGDANVDAADNIREKSETRRCTVATASVKSWGSVHVTVRRGDALHGLIPKKTTMISFGNSIGENSEDANSTAERSKRNARKPCPVPASWVMASLRGKCLPASSCLVLAPGVVANVQCESISLNRESLSPTSPSSTSSSMPSSLPSSTTTTILPVVGSEAAWGVVLSSANIVVIEQASRWSTSAAAISVQERSFDIFGSSSDSRSAAPSVHFGAGEFHLERILMRALEPLNSAANDNAEEVTMDSGSTALMSTSTTEQVILEPQATASQSLKSTGNLSLAALLPALVLVPCATSTAAEAASTNVFAVLQRINSQLRRGDNAARGSSKDHAGLWVEVFDPSLMFLEVGQATSGSGRPGVGSSGAECELGPPFKHALDRCFRAAVRLQPFALLKIDKFVCFCTFCLL